MESSKIIARASMEYEQQSELNGKLEWKAEDWTIWKAAHNWQFGGKTARQWLWRLDFKGKKYIFILKISEKKEWNIDFWE